MSVLALVKGVLAERLCLHHLHLIVLELQLHEAVFRIGYLIIVLATKNGLHGIVGVDLGAGVLEVNLGTSIQLVAGLHDGSHIATHTALLAHSHGEVEVVGRIDDRLAQLLESHVLHIVGVQLNDAAVGLGYLHDIILLGVHAETQQHCCYD